jgi:hypothetical protein
LCWTFNHQNHLGKGLKPISLSVNQMRNMYVPGSEIHVHNDYINDSS